MHHSILHDIVLKLVLFNFVTLPSMLHLITAATPGPDVSLNTMSLNSLSIRWSVPSSTDVSGYVLFWSEVSVVADKSMESGVNINQHTIPNLLSNTAYIITVQANGPLGRTNSTNTVPFYTLPEGMLGSFIFFNGNC